MLLSYSLPSKDLRPYAFRNLRNSPSKRIARWIRGRKSEDQVRKFLGNEVRNAVRNAVPVFPTASDTRLSYIIITMVSSWKQRVR